MARYKMTKNASNKLFRRTAERTKRINVVPNIMRGGIRL